MTDTFGPKPDVGPDEDIGKKLDASIAKGERSIAACELGLRDVKAAMADDAELMAFLRSVKGELPGLVAWWKAQSYPPPGSLDALDAELRAEAEAEDMFEKDKPDAD